MTDMTSTQTDLVAPAGQGQVVLRAVDIAKHYGGIKALKGVDFDIRRGQVTTLFGENGAGKSTLMKIISGVETPTRGRLQLNGVDVQFASTSQALAAGIAIIHQELSLAPNMTVRDNIFLGRELRRGSGAIDYAAENRAVADLMVRLEEDISPHALVSELRLGQQQIVEIAGALLSDARILIMDEPTSALSASEVKVLFRVIDDLTARGVAIVYISHHLEEALHVTDHAVVFRDGELVAQAPASDIDLAWVVEKMVGHAGAGRSMIDRLPPVSSKVVLAVEDLVIADPATSGRHVVDGVSIQVHAGELVCIYGLMGAGRTELLEAIAGRMPIVSGDICLNGVSITRLSIRERINRGLCLVPEDRQRDGLVQLLSIGRNMVLASIDAMATFGLLRKAAERQRIEQGSVATRVKMGSATDLIGSLSGGNQQKVVISKALLTEPQVLVLDEPTRGIDVGAKSEIFDLLAAKAAEGLGVIFVTSEINEALSSAHRVIVMNKGRIVREFDNRDADRLAVMAASGENTEVLEDEGEQ